MKRLPAGFTVPSGSASVWLSRSSRRERVEGPPSGDKLDRCTPRRSMPPHSCGEGKLPEGGVQRSRRRERRRRAATTATFAAAAAERPRPSGSNGARNLSGDSRPEHCRVVRPSPPTCGPDPHLLGLIEHAQAAALAEQTDEAIAGLKNGTTASGTPRRQAPDLAGPPERRPDAAADRRDQGKQTRENANNKKQQQTNSRRKPATAVGR